MNQSPLYHDSIFWIEVDRIKPNPFQPRREFDQSALQELADSIRQYGILQPLTVTRNEIPLEDGGLRVEYELIAGERRLRASKLAGVSTVPVVIRMKEESDLTKLELAIIENLHREDLNAIDRARAFEKLNKEFGFNNADIGRKLGKSREYVSNTIRILNLPSEIQTHVAEGRITEGHTRALLMLIDRPDEQMVLAKEIILKKLTVRETEHIARRVAHDKVRKKGTLNPEMIELENEFSSKLGTRVTIEPSRLGGKLVISYFSADDLKNILSTLQLPTESAVIEAVSGGAEAIETIAAVNDAVTAAANEDISILDDRSAGDKDYSSAEDSDLYTIRNFNV